MFACLNKAIADMSTSSSESSSDVQGAIMVHNNDSSGGTQVEANGVEDLAHKSIERRLMFPGETFI